MALKYVLVLKAADFNNLDGENTVLLKATMRQWQKALLNRQWNSSYVCLKRMGDHPYPLHVGLCLALG